MNNELDIIKAKIAIVNDAREILILTRSELEDSRQGELDLPGGTLDPADVEIYKGALREAEEELPGVHISNMLELGQPHRKHNELGALVVTHIFAATAKFPSGEVALSQEHDAFEWVPSYSIRRLHTAPRKLPKKYRLAIEQGLPDIHSLSQRTA